MSFNLSLWVIAIAETLLPLWILVIVGGCGSLALMVFVAWQQKGAATKKELHEEVGGLEERVNHKFEQERAIARDANAKIYNRLNDTAKAVTSVAAKMENIETMVGKLLDKELKS